jgi:hypothetical protein
MASEPKDSEWRSLVGETVQRSTRKEQRFPASGPVLLLLYEELGTCPATARGELVDRSARGCKVNHEFGELKPGQQVTLVVGGMEISAVVAWSRSSMDRHESGFSFVR